MEFAERLKLLIKGDSVLGFAKKCGIGEGSIRQYLNGGEPGLAKVIAIANACNVSVTWLATGEGTPDAAPSGEELSIGPVMREKSSGRREEPLRRNRKLRKKAQSSDRYDAAPSSSPATMYDPAAPRQRHSVRLPIGPGTSVDIVSDRELTEKQLEALIAQLQLQLQVIRGGL